MRQKGARSQLLGSGVIELLAGVGIFGRPIDMGPAKVRPFRVGELGAADRDADAADLLLLWLLLVNELDLTAGAGCHCGDQLLEVRY